MNLSRYFFARRGRGLIVVFLLVVCSGKSAYAYIDPGAGSYFLQMLAASLFAAVFAIGAYWKKIRNSLASLFSKRNKQ